MSNAIKNKETNISSSVETKSPVSSANSISLKIVSQTGTLLRCFVKEVTVPSISGQLGILYNHIPLIAKLSVGSLSYKKLDDQIETIEIGTGFVRFNENRCIIMLDSKKKQNKKSDE